jgi:hypothetical protein
MKPRTVRRPA